MLDVILLVLSLFIKTSEAAKLKLPENIKVPAIFAFGDSLIDQGNNNFIATPAKANFFPYGKDLLVNGKPTGRFTNGKTAMDFLAEDIGLKELLPAYLDPKMQITDFLTGVSFASGASGFDPLTSLITPCVSLSHQLELFKDTLGKFKTLVGEANTSFIVKNSVFFILSGNDDFIVNYFSPANLRRNYDLVSYANLLASFAIDFVQELYQLGARRIIIAGIAPIGCIPAMRTVNGGKQRLCASKLNQGAQLFNKKLMFEIQSLRVKSSLGKIVYLDLYNIFNTILQNPQKYGFDIINKGCCGTGLIEVSFMCNPLTSFCPDVNQHLFWDSFHPTQQGYRVLVDQISSKIVNQLL